MPLGALYLSLYHHGRGAINLRIPKLPSGSRILFMCPSVTMRETREKGIVSKPWCLPPMIPDATFICSGFRGGSNPCYSLSHCSSPAVVRGGGGCEQRERRKWPKLHLSRGGGERNEDLVLTLTPSVSEKTMKPALPNGQIFKRNLGTILHSFQSKRQAHDAGKGFSWHQVEDAVSASGRRS